MFMHLSNHLCLQGLWDIREWFCGVKRHIHMVIYRAMFVVPNSNAALIANRQRVLDGWNDQGQEPGTWHLIKQTFIATILIAAYAYMASPNGLYHPQP